ncbi:hypothetical protein [Glycomyces buryatensis]|uniref:PE domain-containing protein n=1 Tax=Glycomyces buryatensis TaxID=2570927 RepID=A0A4V4HQM1_9ACTN|nr:hypothetical protein [Glycomyces buryatensis]THV34386.1 hypothetical protein FAB82_24340 [Glycomyces buryatensis]
MAERKFDPDAVARYRDFLLYWLEDVLEADGGPISSMKEGALKKAPAFGTTGEGQTAGETYATSHATAWGNLQALRQSLFGTIQALNAALEGHETSEEYNVDDFKTQYDEVDGTTATGGDAAAGAAGNAATAGGGASGGGDATSDDYENALG